MRIGISPPALDRASLEFVVEAERLGVDSVWVPEAWMYDALTPLGYLAARTERLRLASGVVQLGARSPAMVAMSALALQTMSGGRFVLGIGTSGPQVMEGWHGVRFDRPITRTSETIDIIRTVVSGERLSYNGDLHTLPLPGGQGRALRSPVGGPEVNVPIHVAALGPRNLRLTGEKADGWIGTAFMPESADVFLEPIGAGAAASERSLDDIELSVAASLEFTDDVEAAGRRHAAGYAFTIGAMGSSSTNFYNRVFARQGFAEAIEEVRALWESGDRERAAVRVPIEIGLQTNLVGDDAAVIERLRRYRACGIDTLRINNVVGSDTDADANGHHQRLDALARLLDLVAAVDAEDTAP